MRADRLDPNDPNIARLRELAAVYHTHTRNAETAKAALDRQLAALKAQGYSYPVLAKTAGIAIASVQYAIAKEAGVARAMRRGGVEHQCNTSRAGQPGDEWKCRACGKRWLAVASGKFIEWCEYE